MISITFANKIHGIDMYVHCTMYNVGAGRYFLSPTHFPLTLFDMHIYYIVHSFVCQYLKGNETEKRTAVFIVVVDDSQSFWLCGKFSELKNNATKYITVNGNVRFIVGHLGIFWAIWIGHLRLLLPFATLRCVLQSIVTAPWMRWHTLESSY